MKNKEDRNKDELKKKLSQNLYRLMDERGMNKTDAAQALQVSYNTFLGWANGQYLPSKSRLSMIADFFGVIPETLLGDTVCTDDKIYKADERVYVMPDNSLEDIGILPGDELFIKKQKVIKNGRLALFAYEGREYVRKVYIFSGYGICLVPENEYAKPFFFSEKERGKISIIGEVVCYTRKI